MMGINGNELGLELGLTQYQWIVKVDGELSSCLEMRNTCLFCLILEDLPSLWQFKSWEHEALNHSILGYSIFIQSHINPSEMVVAHIHIFGCLVEVVCRSCVTRGKGWDGEETAGNQWGCNHWVPHMSTNGGSAVLTMDPWRIFALCYFFGLAGSFFVCPKTKKGIPQNSW